MRKTLGVSAVRHRGEPNAYNLITIDPPRVSIEVRVWDDGHFRRSTVTRFHRDCAGSWAPAGAESIDPAPL